MWMESVLAVHVHWLATFSVLKSLIHQSPAGRVEEIDPGAAPSPAPSFVFTFAALRFDDNTEVRRRFVHGVIECPFCDGGRRWRPSALGLLLTRLEIQCRVTYFTANSRDVISHFHRIREIFLIPNEILVLFRIFNIKPEHIDRHVLFIEPLLHTPYVIGADIIPPALMIPKGPVCRQRRCPSELRVLTKTSSGVGPGKMKTSRIPDSDIQCVSVDLGDGWARSIHVSEATALKIATVESGEWACMRGIEPYSDIGDEARYSNTSAL